MNGLQTADSVSSADEERVKRQADAPAAAARDDKSENLVEIAPLFGLQRAAGKREHLESVLDHAIAAGLFDEQDGAISVRNGAGPAT
ncbi:hypothetical protein C8N24_0713 [Solirubrobacter pauli]|uniref:Uncharacterized protein n=1 Tax=Solirubrobacter pauli TaxID=166793 RepID=A0A660L764_9ACTN|nr:hypothetical protein [Solirubrobacter pauli]RKQ90898.1 hypothetical protein C8N24_0713 [Solirubrobacter pauli]